MARQRAAVARDRRSPWAGIYSLWYQQAIKIGGIMLALIIYHHRGDTVPGARNRPPRTTQSTSSKNWPRPDGLTGLRNSP